jgi:hypothetical protein
VSEFLAPQEKAWSAVMSRTRSWSWSVGAVWRGVSAAALLGALLVLLLGGALNNIQVKYARFNNQHDNHPASCARGLFIIDIEHSEFCCDKHYHETDWACMAAYDTVNYVFSSFLAWLIPLVPFVCTVAVDVYSHRSSLSALTSSSSTSSSSSSSVSDKASTQNVAYLFGSHVRRLALYITIFTFRTVKNVVYLIVVVACWIECGHNLHASILLGRSLLCRWPSGSSPSR